MKDNRGFSGSEPNSLKRCILLAVSAWTVASANLAAHRVTSLPAWSTSALWFFLFPRLICFRWQNASLSCAHHMQADRWRGSAPTFDVFPFFLVIHTSMNHNQIRLVQSNGDINLWRTLELPEKSVCRENETTQKGYFCGSPMYVGCWQGQPNGSDQLEF